MTRMSGFHMGYGADHVLSSSTNESEYDYTDSSAHLSPAFHYKQKNKNNNSKKVKKTMSKVSKNSTARANDPTQKLEPAKLFKLTYKASLALIRAMRGPDFDDTAIDFDCAPFSSSACTATRMPTSRSPSSPDQIVAGGIEPTMPITDVDGGTEDLIKKVSTWFDNLHS